MAHLGSSGFTLFALLFFMVITHQAHGRNLGAIHPSDDRICASSVLVHGYKCQEFEVTTKDGYVLSIQRIPEGRSGFGSSRGSIKRPPVLLQHGVLVDGRAWLLNSPEQNLPMILADNGFDVWISNTRGTRFCRQHASLLPNQTEFWDWSWDELVMFDLPAIVGLIYSKTGQKIHYVGHSLGTLIALASISQGLLVDKLRSAALLSPIAYLSHMATSLGVAGARSFLGDMANLAGVAEFNPASVEVEKFLGMLCSTPEVDCYDMMNAITGKNCCLNSSTVSLFLDNEPQSTSTKNLVHLSQTVRDGVLAKYDYGMPLLNIMHYGAIRPPTYNLSNIPHDFPLFLSYGGEDALSDVADVQALLDELKIHDPDKLSVQFVKEYAHNDFILATNAKDIVYNQILSFFKIH